MQNVWKSQKKLCRTRILAPKYMINAERIVPLKRKVFEKKGERKKYDVTSVAPKINFITLHENAKRIRNKILKNKRL